LTGASGGGLVARGRRRIRANRITSHALPNVPGGKSGVTRGAGGCFYGPGGFTPPQYYHSGFPARFLPHTSNQGERKNPLTPARAVGPVEGGTFNRSAQSFFEGPPGRGRIWDPANDKSGHADAPAGEYCQGCFVAEQGSRASTTMFEKQVSSNSFMRRAY